MKVNCPLLIKTRAQKLRIELNLVNAPDAGMHKLFVDTALIPFFINKPLNRFLQACNWLKKKHHSEKDDYKSVKYNKFPSVPDFIEALKATKKTEIFQGYSPEEHTFKDQQEAVKEVRKELIRMRISTLRNNEQEK